MEIAGGVLPVVMGAPQQPMATTQQLNERLAGLEVEIRGLCPARASEMEERRHATLPVEPAPQADGRPPEAAGNSTDSQQRGGLAPATEPTAE